jgi:hypothetical protein
LPVSPAPASTGQSNTDNPSALGYVERYRRRCLRETTGIPDPVTPFFDESVELALSRPHRFKLVLASAGSQVGVPEVQPHTKIRVACTVRARLVTAPSALDVSPATWEPQEYLPPEPSSWTWVVTAKSYGTSEAVLKLRPVLRVSDERGNVLDRDWTTQEYDVTFITKHPPKPDKPLPTVIRDFLTASWEALIALAAGVTMIVGAIVGVRGLARRKASPTEHPPQIVLAPERSREPHTEPQEEEPATTTGTRPSSSPDEDRADEL